MLSMAMVNREAAAFDFLEFAIKTFALMNNCVMLSIHIRQGIQYHVASVRAGVSQDANPRRGMQYRHSITAAEGLDRKRTVLVRILPDYEVNARNCCQSNGPLEFLGDALHERAADMGDMIFVGKAIAESANFSRDTKTLVRMMLVNHSLLGQRFENSVDGRSRNIQFAGKLGRTNAIAPI
jgi:hypothetical protein